MEVILLEDVKSLGKKGDKVKVNDGYARNFILPKKLGVEATNQNLNDLKLQKAHEEKVAKEQLEAAQAFKKELENKSVELFLKVGEGGKTFGTISAKEIDKKKIHVQEPIKSLGTHNVIIKLHPKVSAEFAVKVKEK